MSYKTIFRGGTGEIEEKKSRFIATVQPIASEEEALAFVGQMKKKYWDARHNCYAFTLGNRHELQRASDDGEPGGTAGRPMLGILLKEDVHNCIVVVTRYFGGTLLGTGGLVRAYQAATQAGLAASTIITRQTGQQISLRAEYTMLGKLQFLLAERQVATLDTRYAEAVELDVVVPVEETKAFVAAVTEGTAGQVKITMGDLLEYAKADGEVVLFTD